MYATAELAKSGQDALAASEKLINENKARWRVGESRSKLDDTPTVVLEVGSLQPHIGRFGQKSHLTLTVRCIENTTAVVIDFGGEFMSSVNGRGTVRYRIDDMPAGKLRFLESNDNSALGLWRGAAAIPFIRQMLGRDRLYIEALPFSESMVRAEFPITGLEEAIQPLRNACHW